MQLFDSHCHLNFSFFKNDYKKIISDCLNKKIGIINIGTQIDTSKKAVEIANEYLNDLVFASIGLHPIHSSGTEIDEEEIKFRSREEIFNPEKYQELLDEDKNKKIIAVGEIGLDYFHTPEIHPVKSSKAGQPKAEFDKVKEKQKQGFVEQLKFAKKNNLPIILHARGSKENPEDAYLDLLKILKTSSFAKATADRHSSPVGFFSGEGGLSAGVIHCFGSNLKIAKNFLDLGFYIGFTGIISFKNKSVSALREVVKVVPLNKILVETDSPYLTPEPFRGEKNKPQNVEFVARKIAEIKNVSFEKVCEQTTKNVKRLLKI